MTSNPCCNEAVQGFLCEHYAVADAHQQLPCFEACKNPLCGTVQTDDCIRVDFASYICQIDDAGFFEGVPMIEVRKGQAPAQLGREEFGVRFRGSFIDPAFDIERDAIARLEEIAWEAYREGRKTPHTRKAGPGYADPEYELSVEWRATKERLEKAQSSWADPASPARVLLVCGSARNDGTCPGGVAPIKPDRMRLVIGCG